VQHHAETERLAISLGHAHRRAVLVGERQLEEAGAVAVRNEPRRRLHVGEPLHAPFRLEHRQHRRVVTHEHHGRVVRDAERVDAGVAACSADLDLLALCNEARARSGLYRRGGVQRRK
jgi:hypothetical protein